MATNHGKAEREVKVQRLWRDENGACHYCGRSLSLAECTVDHIIPKAFGGTRAHWNLVVSCEPCNGAYADDNNKCRCRKCVRARERFHHEKSASKKLVVSGPRIVSQWVTPRHVEKILQMIRDRADSAQVSLSRLDDIDSHQAAALRGKINGYREAIVLLSAAYDDTTPPELLAEVEVPGMTRA